MDRPEDKKAKIIQLFKDSSPSPSGNSVNVSGTGHIVAGGDISGTININPRTYQRPVFTPGPEHIDSKTAKKIKDMVDNLVSKDVVDGMEKAKAYAKWYRAIQNHFEVPSYRVIPVAQGEYAVTWLKQHAAIKRRTRAARTLPGARNELYAAIWARAKNLGLSKAAVYEIAATRLGKKIASLKALSDQSLSKLYSVIMSL